MNSAASRDASCICLGTHDQRKKSPGTVHTGTHRHGIGKSFAIEKIYCTIHYQSNFWTCQNCLVLIEKLLAIYCTLHIFCRWLYMSAYMFMFFFLQFSYFFQILLSYSTLTFRFLEMAQLRNMPLIFSRRFYWHIPFVIRKISNSSWFLNRLEYIQIRKSAWILTS